MLSQPVSQPWRELPARRRTIKRDNVRLCIRFFMCLFLRFFLRVFLLHGCKYQFPLALFALNGLLRANIPELGAQSPHGRGLFQRWRTSAAF
jgi:hypothetical protein